jgi:hypothetical protein
MVLRCVVLAVGGPISPLGPGRWDFLPLVGIGLALAVLVVGLRVRPSPPVLASAFVIGNVWAWLVGTWGIVPPTAIAYIAVVVGGSMRRRAQSR